MGRRAARDYGLPKLTVEEAARVLGIAPAAFMDWITVKVQPTPQQWTNWTSADEKSPGLPEVLIRLYLSEHAGASASPAIGYRLPRPGHKQRRAM
jgi:hypothetical protein